MTPIRKHPRQFVVEHISGIDKRAYLGVAYSFLSDDSNESVLIGPNDVAAFGLAKEFYGDHVRMDLAQQVVLMNRVSYQLLLQHAGLTAEPIVPTTGEEGKPTYLRPVKKVGRRRRQIFEESGGKCHYCSCELELEGKWHVEHKFPVALGGGNEPTNLVAACVPCNMKKRDTTDLEFKARLASESPA